MDLLPLTGYVWMTPCSPIIGAWSAKLFGNILAVGHKANVLASKPAAVRSIDDHVEGAHGSFHNLNSGEVDCLFDCIKFPRGRCPWMFV